MLLVRYVKAGDIYDTKQSFVWVLTVDYGLLTMLKKLTEILILMTQLY